MPRTRDAGAAIVGVGETPYYKHGRAPVSEFQLAIEAIKRAADDAGIDVREIDGFASFSDDRNDPRRIAAALGSRQIAFSNMVWGGGGGGGAAAVANAAAAVTSGYANYVVAYRGLAQGQFGRFGRGPQVPTVSWPLSYEVPYGMLSAGQIFAMRVQRFMHEHGVSRSPMKAIALASYHHAQSNPNAVMHGRPLTPEQYDESRWIVEPFRLFDCCQENDGAAAVIVTRADRAAHLADRPAHVLAAAQGSSYRQAAPAHNAPDYGTANFKDVARRLYASAGIAPADVDVVQSYENFTGGVMMSLIEHGFCTPEEAEAYMTFENFTGPSARLPLNTSGGNLAECYMHGFELVVEGVRQVRGTSCNQVRDVEISMVCSGPMADPVSDLILATASAS